MRYYPGCTTDPKFMAEFKKALREKTSAAIDILVADGRAERVVINGRPGVRLIQKQEVEPKTQ